MNKQYERKLNEFLMTTFLVVCVYELISKPIWSYIVHKATSCEMYTSELWEQWEKIANSIICAGYSIFNHIPNWLLGTFQDANKNFVITILSLATTWSIIWFFYKLSYWLFQLDIIKRYMRGDPREDLYTDEFWSILLLSFFLIGWVLLVLYPIFWFIFFVYIIFFQNNH